MEIRKSFIDDPVELSIIECPQWVPVPYQHSGSNHQKFPYEVDSLVIFVGMMGLKQVKSICTDKTFNLSF